MKKVASVAVVTRGGAILWLRRADTGRWTLPGGHFEPGEAPEQAAKRELYEETGIDAKALEPLGVGRTGRYEVHSFVYEPKTIPKPHGENDPDNEADEFLWFKDDLPENPHTPHERNVTLVLMGEVSESSSVEIVNRGKLKKMAIADLEPGEPDDEGGHNYDHLLPPDWQGKLDLRVHWGDEMALARLHDPELGQDVGTVKAYVNGDSSIEPHSDLNEDYHGHGLGKAMYEALYTHAFHNHDIKSVEGGNHSDDAGRVHESLARKHGLDYKKTKSTRWGANGDLKRGPYSYLLKNDETAWANWTNKQAALRQEFDALLRQKSPDETIHKGVDALKFIPPERRAEFAKAYVAGAEIHDQYEFRAFVRSLIPDLDHKDALEIAKYAPHTSGSLVVPHYAHEGHPKLGELLDEHQANGTFGDTVDTISVSSYDPDILHRVYLYNGLRTADVNRMNLYLNSEKHVPDDKVQEVLNTLYSHTPNGERGVLMSNHRVDPAESFEFARRQSTSRRSVLHPDFTSEQLRELYRDNLFDNTDVHEGLARHSNTPVSILRQLYTKNDYEREEFDPSMIYWGDQETPHADSYEDLNKIFENKDDDSDQSPLQRVLGLEASVDSYVRRHKYTIKEDYRLQSRINDLQDWIETQKNEGFDENNNEVEGFDPDFSVGHGYLEDAAGRAEYLKDNERDNILNYHADEWEREQDENERNNTSAQDEVRRVAIAHPNVSREEAIEAMRSDEDDQAKEGAFYNPNLTPKDIQDHRHHAPEHADHALGYLDPDSHNNGLGMSRIKVPDVATEKIRQLRDKIDSMGGITHHKNLGNLPPSVKPLLDNKGQLSSATLQNVIDSAPSTEYWAGPAHAKSTNTQNGKWAGLQRHSDDPSDVFHVNYTNEHVNKMKEAGVWGTFHRIQTLITRPDLTNHPLGPSSIGWVRHTGAEDGIHIDEVQSDLSQHRLRAELRSVGVSVPEDHLTKIKEILWGKRKTGQDLLAETFLHHHRKDPNNHGKQVHWPTMDIKNLVASPPRDTYSRLPKELGFKDGGQYGQLKTQTGEKFRGMPTMTSKITKTQLIDWLAGFMTKLAKAQNEKE